MQLRSFELAGIVKFAFRKRVSIDPDSWQILIRLALSLLAKRVLSGYCAICGWLQRISQGVEGNSDQSGDRFTSGKVLI